MKGKHVLTIVIISIITIVLIMLASYKNIGTNNDWIGFLGGVIGSCFGVLGVYWTMRADQKKREEERKEDYFISNIQTYLEIIHSLDYRSLNEIKKEMNNLKNAKEWYQIDRETKAGIEKIVSHCNRGDEIEGVRDAARDYIIDKCGEKLTVKHRYDLSGEEPIEVDEVLVIALEELLGMISGALNDLVNYSAYTVGIMETKEDFKQSMLSTMNFKNFARHSDEFYYAILDFPESSYWTNYLNHRTNAFIAIREFKESLKLRVEGFH